MDITGEYTFDAPRQLVWNALLDPNVLGSVMPGGKGFEQTAENQYNGVLEVKVGPVQGTFQGQIKLSDIIAPEHYQIEVDGKGATGFVKATGQLQLEPRDQQTHMVYSGQAQVGGRIASVGQRLVESAARSIIRQSLDGLNAYLQIEAARQAPSPAAPAIETAVSDISETVTAAAAAAAPAQVIPAYKPPSQMALGLQVARDVLNDTIPARYQVWVLGAIIALIVLLIWLASR